MSTGTAAPTVPTALDRIPVGAGGRVVSVDPTFREALACEGIHPGTDLTLSATAPFGGPLVVLVGRARIAVARSVARTVHVLRTHPPDESGA